jgi:hypothetical protein
MRGIKYYFLKYYVPLTSAIAIGVLFMVWFVPNPKRIDLVIVTLLVGPALTTILIILSDRYDKKKSDEEL